MKILKNAGSFIILTPKEFLRDQLLMIERAGRTCYQSEKGEITFETATKFARMLLRRGHESVIEHSSMTVQFNNLSRGFTHEQVRHRLTAISQESTRYVDESNLLFVMPPHRDEVTKIDLLDGRVMSSTEMVQEIEIYYRALIRAGWMPEDARQFVPTGVKSQIVITANFREWRHIFFMRTTRVAHWEIRRVMCNLVEEIQEIVPVIFDDFVEAGKDHNGLRYFEQKNSE